MDALKKALTEPDPFTDIIGQNEAKRALKSALLVNRHVVIFGPPGIGKTTLAKNVAKLLPPLKVNDCEFHCLADDPVCPQCRTGKTKKTKTVEGIERFVRVQGSPDLTAEDLLGDIDPIRAMKFGSLSPEAFTPGKIFKANNGILFFDELNRCPEKLQNALLQVLEERKATIGSYDIDIKSEFLFIATMNPEDTNTEKLSDVLLDRFDVIYMGYPETLANELDIVTSKGKSLVKVPQLLMDLLVRFVRKLRDDDKIEKMPSVRATIGLYERSQANAFLAGRKSVVFQDIQDSVVSVLGHRIRLKPSVKYLEDADEYVRKRFAEFSEQEGATAASPETDGRL
jgi:magnesium chelatase subunit I